MKHLRSAMRVSKHRKPPSLHLKTDTREPSPSASSIFSDCDADDEGFMSTEEMPSRPLSLAISTGPYCPRRPTLQEVLTNKAPSPWTLSAFMAYLSQNHCLETLEFTMDAQRYTTHYKSLSQKDPLTPISPNSQDREYMCMLWQKLMDAYIAPNGPREVNLPSDVRDRLLSLPCSDSPPDAAELEPAVRIIHELMDESVLVPFVYSVAPIHMTDSFMGMAASMVSSFEERTVSPSRSYKKKDPIVSPPLSGSGTDIVSQSLSPKASQQSNITAAFNRSRASGISTLVAASSGASSSTEPLDSMTDDSTDSASPSLSGPEPMTPPNTPPTSHVDFMSPSPTSSSQTVRQDSGWKKMGAKFGWKKSSRPGSSTSSARHAFDRGSNDDGSSL
ncbi:RGS domain-containing protein [Bisporella sp. PMI_857]|nr:RGS domain-containing protein [Bisporella sp. PMI_857]